MNAVSAAIDLRCAYLDQFKQAALQTAIFDEFGYFEHGIDRFWGGGVRIESSVGHKMLTSERLNEKMREISARHG